MAVDLCGQNNQTAESLPHDVFFWEAPQGLKRGPLRVIQTQQRWSSEEEKPRQSEVRKIEKVRGKTEVELITRVWLDTARGVVNRLKPAGFLQVSGHSSTP